MGLPFLLPILVGLGIVASIVVDSELHRTIRVALLVVLGVAAILTIPCCLFFRGWQVRVVPAVCASVLAIATMICGELMADGNRVIFEGPMLPVAILVALGVVGILTIPWFSFFRGWKLRVLPVVGASVLAVAAVIYGALAFTGWALYTGGGGRRPGLSEWLMFAAINAILAAAAAIPGGSLGLVIGRAIRAKDMSPTRRNGS
jgi:hypothetical protein